MSQRIIPLPLESQARLGFSLKIKLDNVDLLAWTSATAQAIYPQNTLGSTAIKFPVNTAWSMMAINVTAVFTSSGGAITTLTFSLGDVGSSTRFLNAVDLKTAGYTASANVLFFSTGANLYLTGVATIVGQTMASLNGGTLELYLEKLDVPDLVAVSQP